MLHTISRSFTVMDSDTLLALLNSDDVIVLMQDGVVNGLTSSQHWLDLAAKGCHCFALQSDISARGLEKYLAPEITLINTEQFVELTVRYFPQMAW